MKVPCILLFVRTCLFFKTTWGHALDQNLYTSSGGFRNAGLKMKLTSAGLNYVQKLSMGLLRRQILEVEPPGEILSVFPLNQGHARIRGAKVTKFQTPIHFNMAATAPSRLDWTMAGVEMQVRGVFDGAYGTLIPLNISGFFEAQIYDMNFDISAHLKAAPSGHLQIKTESCNTVIHAMDLGIDRAGILSQTVFTLLRKAIVRRVKPVIEVQLCKNVRAVIDNSVNNLLLSMPTKTSVVDNVFTFDQDFLLANLSTNPFAVDSSGTGPRNLIIDYRLLSSPEVINRSITTHHSGEISWRDNGQTPFYPHPMTEAEEDKNSPMLRIYASDYILNSLLHHAHEKRMLRFRINPKTAPPGLKGLLRTTCDSPLDYNYNDFSSEKSSFWENFETDLGSFNNKLVSFCLGDIVPSLVDLFPNKQLELRFRSAVPPTMFIHPGSLTLKSLTSLFLSLYPEPKFLMHALVSFEANVTLEFRLDQRIAGKISDIDLKIKPTKGRIKEVTDEAILDIISDFVKKTITSLSNQIMQEGLPLPLIEGLKLVNPEMYLKKHFLRLDTDINLDENYLNTLLTDIVQSIIV